jgi:hypothetical protein
MIGIIRQRSSNVTSEETTRSGTTPAVCGVAGVSSPAPPNGAMRTADAALRLPGPTDPIVLAQHHSVVVRGKGDPLLTLDVLRLLLSVDVGERPDSQPGSTQTRAWVYQP